jgi:formate hydrogenlyase subunit 6/NADH:ubiquinone oxidoreductase subunit I
MEAATLEGDAVNINLDRCIGCGVCIANCPSDALELKTKEKLHVPPKNSEELYSQIDQRRKELDKGKN